MAELNIVELIENNLFTKLSNTYNNKLLDKIQYGCSNYEKQLFISNYYCYLHYSSPYEFVIDLDNIWEWLGFTQKVTAKTLLEKHFLANTDYNISRTKPDQHHGGHNKEKIMLTTKCFKLFCLKSHTTKSADIHEYYITIEQILHNLVEENSVEFKQKMETAKIIIDQKEEIHKNELMQHNALNQRISNEREQFLLNEYGVMYSILYIIKVKTNDDGSYIIKIGESCNGVHTMYNEYQSKYPTKILLMDCFIVNRSKEFQSFIHNHKDIKFNRVTDLPGHENELDLFCVNTKLTYQLLLHIINIKVKPYNEYTNSYVEQLEDKKETYEVMAKLLAKIENLEKTNKEILAKLNV